MMNLHVCLLSVVCVAVVLCAAAFVPVPVSSSIIAPVSGASSGSTRSSPRRVHGALNFRLDSSHFTPAALQDGPVIAQFFSQTLDHFDLALSTTFKQKYYVNDTHWNPSQPIIFFQLGGEGPVSPDYVTGHYNSANLAEEFGAMQIALEHRFYGSSVPEFDYSTANLRYLSSAQALADLVTFHQHITTQYPSNSPAKWILFGGSYSGSLAAWARQKYPNLFLGALAASAPIQAELNFAQFYDVVSASLGPAVSTSLSSAISTINEMLSSPVNRSALQSSFMLCSPIVTDLDVATFMRTLTIPYSQVVQYNHISASVNFDIGVIQQMTTAASSPLAALTEISMAYAQHIGESCVNINYDQMIQGLASNYGGDERSWMYQQCSEFGFFQTGQADNQPFSPLITLDYLVNQCAAIFNITNFTPHVDYINGVYGGANIVTEHTVFTNGDIDPWHVLGNYQTYSSESLGASILIHGTAHCADMYPPRSTDPPGLTAARQVQQELMHQWLNK